MTPDATDLLKRYVALHNDGVRPGDFTQLLGLFAPDAVMRFEGIAMGPLHGASAIAHAFSTHPPDDELELITFLTTGGQAIYGWATYRGVEAGRLGIRERDGLIVEIVVTSSDKTNG